MDAQDRKEIMNVILFRQEYQKQLKEKKKRGRKKKEED